MFEVITISGLFFSEENKFWLLYKLRPKDGYSSLKRSLLLAFCIYSRSIRLYIYIPYIKYNLNMYMCFFSLKVVLSTYIKVCSSRYVKVILYRRRRNKNYLDIGYFCYILPRQMLLQNMLGFSLKENLIWKKNIRATMFINLQSFVYFLILKFYIFQLLNEFNSVYIYYLLFFSFILFI